MRDDLNDILSFIGAESLTDEEFDSIDLENMENQVDVYNSLLVVLESRESVSDMAIRLQNYFLAQGVIITSPEPTSNIFVGSVLE
jgi:hypothetical protein